jgi:hypothetical protein
LLGVLLIISLSEYGRRKIEDTWFQSLSFRRNRVLNGVTHSYGYISSSGACRVTGWTSGRGHPSWVLHFPEVSYWECQGYKALIVLHLGRFLELVLQQATLRDK